MPPTLTADAVFLPMLVCQCNVITDREIKQVIVGLLREDPWQIIVPAMVYRELAKRCKCAGCVPNVVDIIITVTEEYHLQLAEKPADAPVVHARLSAMRRKRQGGRNERRSTGHRAA
ncbi:(2Fe-2S)-binding protein [Devosia insulae]|uniref:(2Fe-2S)-binding protein n=2 Tax=Devosia TaxID=46913 RepID=UPI003CC7A345